VSLITIPLAIVVDNDARSRRATMAALRDVGISVLAATTADQAVTLATIAVPDAPLFYLVNYGRGATERADAFCRELRARSCAPIVAIIPRRRAVAHDGASWADADACITRPLRTRDLTTRLVAHFGAGLDRGWPWWGKALMDRSPHRVEHVRSAESLAAVFMADGLTLDFDRRDARRDGVRIGLSKTEWNILYCLAETPGAIVARERLAQTVWPNALADQAGRRLRVHMTYLRRKLERVRGEPRVIRTEPGYGYGLIADRQPSPSLVRAVAIDDPHTTIR
jgi:two-component system KDP operon response regulator KdpE